MKRADLVSLTKRMLDMIDQRTTDLAESIRMEPVTVYTSSELLTRERSMIFGRTPMFIGLSADIPTPGSWRTMDLVDTPLLMCRNGEGLVRLYLNSCRHRGVKLVEGSGQNSSFSCPFHGWRYSIDGALTGVSEPEGFEELCRDHHGLISLPVAEKYGMIFGSPVPGPAIDVDDLLCGLGPELQQWGFESFQLYTAHHLHPFRGNWKFAWDTYCENYHFAYLHRETLKDYLYPRRQAVDFFGPHVRMVSALRSIDELRRQPEEDWEPGRHLSLQYRLFPSVSFSVYPTEVEVYWILPGLRADEGYGIHAVYLAEEPQTDEERKALDEKIFFGCETVVNGEDLWITGQSEPGLRAPAAADCVVIGRNEPVVQHFHTWFRRAVEAGASEPVDPRLGGASPHPG